MVIDLRMKKRRSIKRQRDSRVVKEVPGPRAENLDRNGKLLTRDGGLSAFGVEIVRAADDEWRSLGLCLLSSPTNPDERLPTVGRRNPQEIRLQIAHHRTQRAFD
jgi:hypothetical protein